MRGKIGTRPAKVKRKTGAPVRLYLTSFARQLIAEVAERRGEPPAAFLAVVLGWGLAAFELKRGARATRWRERSPGTAVETEQGIFEVTLCPAARRTLAAVIAHYKTDEDDCHSFPARLAAETVLGDALTMLDLPREIAAWWDRGEWPASFTTDNDGDWFEFEPGHEPDAQPCDPVVVDFAAERARAAYREEAADLAAQALSELRAFARRFLAGAPAEDTKMEGATVELLNELSRLAGRAGYQVLNSLTPRERDAVGTWDIRGR